MTICTGVCWSPARLVEEGVIPLAEAKCPLCGQQGVDEGHLFCECPKVLAHPHPSVQKSNRFCAEYMRHKNDPKSRALYWGGILPENETKTMDHILETEESLGDINEYGGEEATIYTDGSGGIRSKDEAAQMWVGMGISAKRITNPGQIWCQRSTRRTTNGPKGRTKGHPPLSENYQASQNN